MSVPPTPDFKVIGSVPQAQQRRFIENGIADLRRVAYLLSDDELWSACMKLSRSCYGDSGSDEAHQLEAVVLVKRVRAAS